MGEEKFVRSVTSTDKEGRSEDGIGEKRVSSKALFQIC